MLKKKKGKLVPRQQRAGQAGSGAGGERGSREPWSSWLGFFAPTTKTPRQVASAKSAPSLDRPRITASSSAQHRGGGGAPVSPPPPRLLLLPPGVVVALGRSAARRYRLTHSCDSRALLEKSTNRRSAPPRACSSLRRRPERPHCCSVSRSIVLLGKKQRDPPGTLGRHATRDSPTASNICGVRFFQVRSSCVHPLSQPPAAPPPVAAPPLGLVMPPPPPAPPERGGGDPAALRKDGERGARPAAPPPEEEAEGRGVLKTWVTTTGNSCWCIVSWWGAEMATQLVSPSSAEMSSGGPRVPAGRRRGEIASFSVEAYKTETGRKAGCTYRRGEETQGHLE